MFFFNIDHASQYLNGCLVRYGGDAVRIVEVRRNQDHRGVVDVCIQYTNRDKHGIDKRKPAPRRIRIDDPLLNLTPVPLGLVNVRTKEKNPRVLYACRMPARQWKVGLTPRNIGIWPVIAGGYTVPRDMLFQSSYLARTVEGDFPSYDECLEIGKDATKRANVMAFSRRFAIGSGRKVYYKALGESVGMARPAGVELFDHYAYLIEVLEKDINRQ